MRPFQNPPLPPRIHPSFQHLYATLPQSTPPSQNNTLFSTTMCDPTPPSQNIPTFSTPICHPPKDLPLPLRIYPRFQQLYATLSESIPPSQNIPHPFSVTICDRPRIYPSLPEYTPLFNTYMRPSQNLPLPPRIYPLPFYLLYATLPESTPPSQNTLPLFNNYNMIRPFQNLPHPPRIYSPFRQLYATLTESTRNE